MVALVNKSNTVVNQYTYTPFGEAMSTSEQVPQPLRFGARELDAESGLYYNRARYYDPSLARFISEDPIGLAGGVNPYAYAGNNPVDYVDPSGLDQCSPDAIAHGYHTASIDGEILCVSNTASLPPVVITADPTSGWAQNPSDRGSTWPAVIAMGLEWLTGAGPTYHFFRDGSPQVNDMRTDPHVALLKDLACAAGPGPVNLNQHVDFGLSGLMDAGMNATRQYVGSFDANVRGSGNGNVTFMLTNTTSLWSASYHILPSGHRGEFFPFVGSVGLAGGGNTAQFFTWREACW